MTQKKSVDAEGKKAAVGLALTWDGARWSTRSLPIAAKEFLRMTKKADAAPGRETMARLFAEDEVREIRVCWVPRLAGGENVLTEPFRRADGKRLGFRVVKVKQFGEVLGIVYRRKA